MGSLEEEESESHDLEAEVKRTRLGKQEPKDPVKRFAQLMSSGSEPGIPNTFQSCDQTRTLENYEKPKKDTEAPLTREPLVNGSSTPVPKVESSVTAGIAS